MSIARIMSKCVTECTEDTPLEDVYEQILKCEHGLVVVVDSTSHRVPIGIVSERSICEGVIRRGKNPRNLAAGSVMDSRIRVVRETDSLDLTTAGLDQISAVIVTDERRQVCGIVPKSELKPIDAAIATHSPGRIIVNVSERSTPATREIPAFGWVQ